MYDIQEIVLQDDTVVEIRPLPIKRLRQANAILAEFSKRAESKEFDKLPPNDVNEIFVDHLLRVVVIVLEKKYKDLVTDIDELSDNLDEPTMYKIVETATGWNFNQEVEVGKAMETVDGKI